MSDPDNVPYMTGGASQR